MPRLASKWGQHSASCKRKQKVRGAVSNLPECFRTQSSRERGRKSNGHRCRRKPAPARNSEQVQLRALAYQFSRSLGASAEWELELDLRDKSRAVGAHALRKRKTRTLEDASGQANPATRRGRSDSYRWGHGVRNRRWNKLSMTLNNGSVIATFLIQALTVEKSSVDRGK